LNDWTAAKFLSMDASAIIPLAKYLQEDQLNSRRFLLFQGVVDTVLSQQASIHQVDALSATQPKVPKH